MAAKKMKWSPLRAAALAGPTVAALIIACDTEAPTAIDDALLDVLASPETAADGDGSGNLVSKAVEIMGTLRDGPQPLIFVDGVEVTNEDGALYRSLDPDDIGRIEVIKRATAVGLVGDRAAGGVIHIFTKEYVEELDLEEPQQPAEPQEPSSSPTPPPAS